MRVPPEGYKAQEDGDRSGPCFLGNPRGRRRSRQQEQDPEGAHS